jgi:ribosome-associated toxin RatA of RatAB toxin-antitoxin module
MTFVPRRDRAAMTGGRVSARQLSITLMMLPLALGTIRGAEAQSAPVAVRVEDGVYHVSTSFVTTQPVAIAHAVLTDYEQIPRFMPDVRTSRIVERSEGRVIVEQEAVARVLLFSKRISLVLEIEDQPAVIRFRDRSGRSFTRYEGHWTLRDEDGRAVVGYELTAQPAFEVPEFLLTRLLRRDADRMIERLQVEITARAVRLSVRQ